MNQPHRFPIMLAALGGLLILNGLFGILWLFDGAERFSQTAGSWEFSTFQRVNLLSMVLLAVLVPGFGQLRGRTGARLSPAVLTALTGAVVLQAGTVFVMAFVAPFYAKTAPATLDVENGGSFQVAMSAAWILFAAAIIALGVSALRTKTLPRASGVLLVVGALVTPVLGPIGSVAVGAAFLHGGQSLARSATALDRTAAERVPSGLG